MNSNAHSQREHNSKRHMHPCILCSTVYDSQDIEATGMSINREMTKERAVHISSGILLSHIKNKCESIQMRWIKLESVIGEGNGTSTLAWKIP